MKKFVIVAIGFVLFAGCSVREHDVDISKIKACDGFKWNGRMTVVDSQKSLFGPYDIDSIRLHSDDGRELKLVTTNCGLKTFLLVDTSKGSTAPQTTGEMNTMQESQE